ncbi:amine oxidase, partial [Candidatus Woesearchaeota archaeon CG11_big_fil_rev_8_21_14_0_20_43_8]
WSKVVRTKYAEPVYDKDYAKYMIDHRTDLKGFYLAGIQHTYPKIRNMNTALESGIKISKLVEEDIDNGDI